MNRIGVRMEVSYQHRMTKVHRSHAERPGSHGFFFYGCHMFLASCAAGVMTLKVMKFRSKRRVKKRIWRSAQLKVNNKYMGIKFGD